MHNLPTGRLKPGEKQLIRTVPQLHPTVEVKLSPADVDYYRALGPWALVLDRQSHKAELTNEEATGHQNRVRNCQTLARTLGLTLPAPLENENRQDGEFQFFFDRDECRYHWFVDGLESNASGYTASPWARLQLWRAAKIARLLRRFGCPPTAVLIGELTRFFRDQRQFMDWYHILKDSGARIHIYGCPEMTPENEGMILPMLLCQTDALSAWLKRQNRMARETRRAAGKLFKRRAPFGLQFNLDEDSKGFLREVFPHPVEWPLLQRLIAQICDGALTNRAAAMAWLVAEGERAGVAPARLPRSRSWLTLLLQDDMLRGVYYQYAETYQACRIEEAEEEGRMDMDTDWDYTAKGNRRYLVSHDRETALRFDILLAPNEEIPAAQIDMARQILSRTGRPRSEASRLADRTKIAQSLLHDGLIHCEICGSVVHERGPRISAPENNRWTRAADLQLVELIHQGRSAAQIADDLGLQTHRVENRRSRMQYQGVDRALDLARLERHWDDPFARRMATWHLYCNCVGRAAAENSLTAAHVRDWPVAQHVRKRNGSITLALEPLLWDALLTDTHVDLSRLPEAPNANVSLLEAEASRLTHRIQRVQQAYENEDWTLYTPEEARVRLADLRGELAAVQAKIAAAHGSRLDTNDHQETIAWEQTRQQLCQMLASPHFQESLDQRRRIMDLCITRVTVDLETGAFEAHTRLHAPSLQKLCGAVLFEAPPNVLTGRDPGVACLYDKRFVLRGHVRLAA